MAEVTDEMVDRAAAVILEPPGLQYFFAPHAGAELAMAHNREIIRRALAAALQPADIAPSGEDWMNAAMAGCRCAWTWDATGVAVRNGPHAGCPVHGDEDRIRDAMAEARDHPGRVVTR